MNDSDNEYEYKEPAAGSDRTKELTIVGRWVKTYHQTEGIKKRAMPAIYGDPITKDTMLMVLINLLRQISRRNELSQVMFLVAPCCESKFHRKMHCFDRETKKHLGTTCITKGELQLLQKYEMMLKYDVLFTGEYLPLKTLASNKKTIAMIINFNKLALLNDDMPEPQPKIKSLRVPKIPVRLRANDIKKEELMKQATSQAAPVWRI